MFNDIKVCIYVDNQDRAIEFYTKKLGFEVAMTHSMGLQGNWVELVHNRGSAPPGSLSPVDDARLAGKKTIDCF